MQAFRFCRASFWRARRAPSRAISGLPWSFCLLFEQAQLLALLAPWRFFGGAGGRWGRLFFFDVLRLLSVGIAPGGRGHGCRRAVRSPVAAGLGALFFGDLGDVHEARKGLEKALLDVFPVLPGDLAQALPELGDVALEEVLALALALGARPSPERLRELATAFLQGERDLAQKLGIVGDRFFGLAGERHPDARQVDEDRHRPDGQRSTRLGEAVVLPVQLVDGLADGASLGLVLQRNAVGEAH